MKLPLTLLIVLYAFPLIAQPKTEIDSFKNLKVAIKAIKGDSMASLVKKGDSAKFSYKDSHMLFERSQVDTVERIPAQEPADKNNPFQLYWYPLITLAIGAILTLASEFVRGWFVTKKAGRRWIGQAKLYVKVIEAQENLIKEFLATEKPDKWGIEALNRATHIEGYQFNSYREDELLDYMEQRRFAKEEDALRLTGRFTGTLSALALTYRQLDDSYRIYQNTISRYAGEATDILRSIAKAIGDWETAAMQRRWHPGEQKVLDDVKVLWETEVAQKESKDLRNIFALEQLLYNPMIQILFLGYTIPEIYAILKVLEVAKHAVKRIQAEKEYMIENATTLLARYQEYRQQLEENINDIKTFKGLIKKQA